MLVIRNGSTTILLFASRQSAQYDDLEKGIYLSSSWYTAFCDRANSTSCEALVAQYIAVDYYNGSIHGFGIERAVPRSICGEQQIRKRLTF